MTQQPQPDQWSAFHSNSFSQHVDDMRHQDRLDYSAKCDHAFGTWAGNPMVNMCRCGEWHWKK